MADPDPPEPSMVLLNLAHKLDIVPTDKIFNSLVNAYTHAGFGIASTFFGNSTTPFTPNSTDHTTSLNSFAQAYMSWQVSLTSGRGFRNLIDGNAASIFFKNWFFNEGETIGRDMFFQYLLENESWGDVLKAKEAILKSAESLMTTEAFATAEILPVLALGNYLPIQNLLLFLSELDGKGPVFVDVMNNILNHIPETLDPDAFTNIDTNFFDGIISMFYSGSQGLDYVNIEWKINTSVSSSTSNIFYNGQLLPPTITETTTTYGAGIANWINSGDAGSYGNGRRPENIAHSSETKSCASCFITGTSVATFDKSNVVEMKPIQLLTEGDVIVSANGSPSIVSDEIVSCTLPEGGDIYSFNDEEPFFTSSHMFWTNAGWKCLNPEMAKYENKFVNATELEIGDIVLKLSEQSTSEMGIGEHIYEEVEVKRINVKVLSRTTSVYGVHVREGVRSYHANGYLVAINYPELTSATVVNNIRSRLSLQERNILCHNAKKIRPSLEKAVGSNTLHAIEQELLIYSSPYDLTEPPHVKIATEKRKEFVSDRMSHIQNRRKDLLYEHKNLDLTLSITPGTISLEEVPNYALPNLTLSGGGIILVDGSLPDYFHVDHDEVRWSRTVANDATESGHVRLQPHGRLGYGAVQLSSMLESFQVNAVQRNNLFHDAQGRFSVRLDHSLDAYGRPATLHCVVLSNKGTKVGSGTCNAPEKDSSRISISISFAGSGWASTLRQAEAVVSWDQTVVKGCSWDHDNSKPGLLGKTNPLTLYVDGNSKYPLAGVPPVRIPELSEIPHRRFTVKLKESSTYDEKSVTIELENGGVFVNGDPVYDPQFENGCLSWRRILSNGSVEKCQFFIKSPYLSGSGLISRSAPKDTITASETLQAEKFTGAAYVQQYLSIDNQLWDYSVKLGYTEEGAVFAYLINNTSGSVFKSVKIATSADASGRLNYTMTVDSLAASLGFPYIYASITLGDFGATSVGTIYSYDAGAPDYRGKSHKIVGNVNKPTTFTSARSTLLSRQPVVQTPPNINAEAQASAMSVTASLSIQSLLHMAPPDPLLLNEHAQRKITELALNAMSSDQLSLIGAVPPKIDAEDMAFVTNAKILTFFQDYYAKAYIAQAFRTMSQFNAEWKDTTAADNSLKFFWSSSSKGTLGSYPEFTTIQDYAGRKSFKDITEKDLQPFFVSKELSAEEWAENLYNQLAKDNTTFNMLVDQYLAHDQHQLNKYSMILYTLAPKKKYATKLWNAVVWQTISRKMLQTTVTDQDTLNQFIPQAFEALILNILDSSNDVMGELKKYAMDALAEMKIDTAQSNAILARNISANTLAYQHALQGSMRGISKGTFAQKMAKYSKEIVEKYPKATALTSLASSVAGLVAFGYAIYQSYESILNWSSFTLMQKVQTVTNMLSGIGEGVFTLKGTVESIQNMMKSFRNESTDIDAMVEASENVDSAVSTVECATGIGDSADTVATTVDETLSELDNPGLVRLSTGLSEISDVGGQASVVIKLSTVFNVVSKFACALNVLALAAATVSIGLQVKSDFDSNVPISLKVIDTINLVVTGIATCIAFGALVMGTAIPVVGIVLIAIGAILMAVATIIRKNLPKPKTDQQKWIDSTGNDFVASLPKVTPYFSIRQFELKPTAKMVSGKTDVAFFTNLMGKVVSEANVSSSGKYDGDDSSWASANNSMEIGLKQFVGRNDHMYVIVTEKLASIVGNGAKVWTTNNSWEAITGNLSIAANVENFFHYRVDLTSSDKSVEWSLSLQAGSAFKMSAAVQNIDIEKKPMNLKLPN